MNEWNIQSRAHHCQACGKAFEDRATYHTLLFDEPNEGYVRRDICAGCWKSEFAEGAEQEGTYLSYWQGTYEAPPPDPPDPIQKENAETLLRRLIELNHPKFASAGFILAVMLERKRQLKIKEQIQQDNQRLFVYEHPKTGDIFTLADPALQLTQLDDVQKQVADLLEFGLTPEGEIAYPPEPENQVISAESTAPQSAAEPKESDAAEQEAPENDNEDLEEDAEEDEEDEDYDDDDDDEEEDEDEDDDVSSEESQPHASPSDAAPSSNKHSFDK